MATTSAVERVFSGNSVVFLCMLRRAFWWLICLRCVLCWGVFRHWRNRPEQGEYDCICFYLSRPEKTAPLESGVLSPFVHNNAKSSVSLFYYFTVLYTPELCQTAVCTDTNIRSVHTDCSTDVQPTLFVDFVSSSFLPKTVAPSMLCCFCPKSVSFDNNQPDVIACS